jgi:hypothetical protein
MGVQAPDGVTHPAAVVVNHDVAVLVTDAAMPGHMDLAHGCRVQGV